MPEATPAVTAAKKEAPPSRLAIPLKMHASAKGVLSTLRAFESKKGQAMAIGQLDAKTGPVKVVFLPRAYDRLKSVLTQGARLAMKGTVQIAAQGGVEMLVEEAEPA